MSEGRDIEGPDGETEEVDAVLVPAEEAALPAQAASQSGRTPGERTPRGHGLAALRSAPAVQTVAVAAGGFLTGAAVVGLARRRRAAADRPRRQAVGVRRSRRGRRLASRGGAAQLLQVVGSRSFLVDVHLLAPVTRER